MNNQEDPELVRIVDSTTPGGLSFSRFIDVDARPVPRVEWFFTQTMVIATIVLPNAERIRYIVRPGAVGVASTVHRLHVFHGKFEEALEQKRSAKVPRLDELEQYLVGMREYHRVFDVAPDIIDTDDIMHQKLYTSAMTVPEAALLIGQLAHKHVFKTLKA